jgi:hypothetical protein
MTGYAQYHYLKPDGTFDYDAYVKSQSAANVRKLRHQWARPRTIGKVSRYLRSRIPSPTFGLCHGTRRGVEQSYFKDRFPGCVVLGTEISPTATQFPDTIQWDYHEIKTEWIGAADFVYSNSLDHAYDPQLAVSRWMQSLKTPGFCFIEWWQPPFPKSVEVDCFSATVEGCMELLTGWGKIADYSIVDTLTHIRSPRREDVVGRDGVVFVLAKDK